MALKAPVSLILMYLARVKYHILCQYKQAFIVLSCPRVRNISVKVSQLFTLILIQFGVLHSHTWYSLINYNNGKLINFKHRFGS